MKHAQQLVPGQPEAEGEYATLDGTEARDLGATLKKIKKVLMSLACSGIEVWGDLRCPESGLNRQNSLSPCEYEFY